ncbi:MAG: histidine phosphatase family protein [Chloroflexota bacterium]|nr:histidine phosphatase family protein [Ardenticatenaceae bacterium]
MPIVWLIRHGESVSNANLPTVHPEESQLTPHGELEAQYVVQAFPRKPDLIVVSPYVRARQTAVPTITHFDPVPVVEWPVYEFTYLDPQRYDGTTGSDRAPFARAYWERNDPHYKDGDGESFAELLDRVHALTARLKAHPADFIAVFSHGMFLRALIWFLLTGTTVATAETMRRYGRFLESVRMPNTAICKAHFSQDSDILMSGFITSHLPAKSDTV